MNEIEVNFLHPTNGNLVNAYVDLNMTAAEVIETLIEESFLAPHPDGYRLTIKGGNTIRDHERLRDAGVSNGSVLRAIPTVRAGGSISPDPETQAKRSGNTGIPGLRKTGRENFSIGDIQKSPEALIMIVNLFEDLQLRHEALAKDLEVTKLRSSNRLTATLLLLISQIVLSIGGNLLTHSVAIGIIVLTAGSLQALLAIFLTFRNVSGKS